MDKKSILILSSSSRKGGNSDLLCDEFMRGALETGHSVEKINISEKNISYCTGCYFCKTSNGVCAIKDDMQELLAKIIETDVLVLATPVYFYSVSAQLKTVIDRTVARWKEIKDKDMYYILVSGDHDMNYCNTTLNYLRQYAKCIQGAHERGIICGVGVYNRGEVRNTKVMIDAYEMGKRV